MSRDEIRLECLKLVFRHDRDQPGNIAEAKILEGYVFEEHAQENPAVEPARKPGRPKKVVVNSDIPV